ncbi:MAG: hypothetical protein M1405_02635 [Patescibacteria group bacterium]|nr:hypothetical protein [Patescibacteria group bacterium]
MTKIKTFIHGVYPRSEILAQTTRDVERKRLSKEKLWQQLKNDFNRLYKLQKNYNLDYFEDGKLNWQDIFRPIIESTKGLEVGPLTRWFDNNCFYRQPVINAKLRLDEKKIAKFFPKPRTGKWKVTLLSPYAFAMLTKDTNSSFAEKLDKLTKLTAELIKYLDERGANIIQLNEPCIPYYKATKKEIDVFAKSIEILKKTTKNSKLAVYFYFGDSSLAVKTLNRDNLVDIVGVDFFKTDLSSLPKKLKFDFIAGVLDGRNSLVENEEALKKFIKEIIKYLKPEVLYISNSSELDLLPEPVARKKVELLLKVKNYFSKHD